MDVILNGKKIKLDGATNISRLLSVHGYADKLVAVAVNGHFVAKSQHDEHVINNNDEIEIVAPMQGG